MASIWRSLTQLTPPRGSLLDVEALLKDAEDRFLANDKPTEIWHFTKHHMKKFAIEAALLAFVQRGGPDARRLVKRDFSVGGEVEDHPFSLAIANGRPLVAAEIFSSGPIARARRKTCERPRGHLMTSASDNIPTLNSPPWSFVAMSQALPSKMQRRSSGAVE